MHRFNEGADGSPIARNSSSRTADADWNASPCQLVVHRDLQRPPFNFAC